MDRHRPHLIGSQQTSRTKSQATLVSAAQQITQRTDAMEQRWLRSAIVRGWLTFLAAARSISHSRERANWCEGDGGMDARRGRDATRDVGMGASEVSCTGG